MILGALLLLPASAARAGPRLNATARRCGVDAERPSDRMFADPDGKAGWREYATIKDVPTLELGAGQFARVWRGKRGSTLVFLQEPLDDFSSYTYYCYDGPGRLVQVNFELRTAWGWGYREEGRVEHGKLAAKVSEFFDTKNESPIPRPTDADDISEALKPRLYLRISDLPSIFR